MIYTKSIVAGLLWDKCKELKVSAHTNALALSGLHTLIYGKFGLVGSLPSIIKKYRLGINGGRLLFTEKDGSDSIKSIMIDSDCRVIPSTILLSLWHFIQENNHNSLDVLTGLLCAEVERVNVITPPPLKYTLFARAFRNKSIKKITILQQQEIDVIFQAVVYLYAILNYLPREEGILFILKIWRLLEPSR